MKRIEIFFKRIYLDNICGVHLRKLGQNYTVQKMSHCPSNNKTYYEIFYQRFLLRYFSLAIQEVSLIKEGMVDEL